MVHRMFKGSHKKCILVVKPLREGLVKPPEKKKILKKNKKRGSRGGSTTKATYLLCFFPNWPHGLHV